MRSRTLALNLHSLFTDILNRCNSIPKDTSEHIG